MKVGMTLKNMDYAKIESNKDLVAAFKEKMKSVVVAAASMGDVELDPKGIEVSLSAGEPAPATKIDVIIMTPDSLQAEDVAAAVANVAPEVMAQLMMGSLATVPGITDAMAGIVSVEQFTAENEEGQMLVDGAKGPSVMTALASALWVFGSA